MSSFNLKKYFLIISIFFFCFLNFPQKVFADNLNQEGVFFVEKDYDLSSREEVAAVLKKIGTHAYFYIEEDYWDEKTPAEQNQLQSYLDELSSEFDRTIYPKLRQTLGAEWSPGIDNDSKITVFLVQMSGDAKGFFRSEDEYPKRVPGCSNSNEREIVYLNVDFLDTSLIKSFLAHEFQHLINFNQKERLKNIYEDLWLNEARSEYAPTLCGYDDDFEGSNLERRVKDFILQPSDPLGEWLGEVYDYGSVSLFIHYLVDHYGEEILTEMMNSNKAGIASIDEALKKFGFQENFEDVFTNWMTANFLNDTSIDSSKKYGYLSDYLDYSTLHIRPEGEYLISQSTDLKIYNQIKDWAGRLFKFKPSLPDDLNTATLRLTFDGQKENGNFRIPILMAEKNGGFEIKEVPLNDSQDGVVFVENFGKEISWAVMAVSNQYKKTGFGDSEPLANFSFSAKISSSFSEGSLVRQKGDYKVYIIKGNYKRHILSGEIFNFYGHLDWDKIIEVEAEQNNSYLESSLVRASSDQKVYEINGDGTKHWLNMTAEQFEKSGRKWEMVYIINQQELNFYQTGPEVLFKS